MHRFDVNLAVFVCFHLFRVFLPIRSPDVVLAISELFRPLNDSFWPLLTLLAVIDSFRPNPRPFRP